MNLLCTTLFLPDCVGLAVTSAVLTSNVERGGSHLACPGQVVVLTCSETGTAILNWNSDIFMEIQYNYGIDQEGTIKPTTAVNTFTANLTEAVTEGSVTRKTSTLTFTFTGSMDGLTVECTTLVNGQVMSRMATVEITGTIENTTAHNYTKYSTIPALTSTALPSPPQSPQLSVSEFNVGWANITVKWTYPDDGPAADNYTVSLSVGEPVTTTELMAIFGGVPYDQPLIGSVVATNCIGSGSPALLEGTCV